MANNVIEFSILAKDEFTNVMKSVGDSLDTMSGRMAVGAAAVAAVATAFVKIVDPVFAAAEAQLNMAQKLGVTTEQLGKLQAAATLANVDSGTLSASMRILSKAMSDANDPASEQAILLKELGVTAKKPIDAMYQIADAMKDAEEGTGKNNAAQLLLGRGYQSLFPLLNQGSDAMREQGEQASRLGGIFDQELSVAADNVRDNMGLLGTRLDSILKDAILPLAPALKESTDKWVKFAENSQAAGVATQAVSLALKVVGNLLVALADIVLSVAEIIGITFKAIGTVVGGVVAAIVAAMRGDFKESGEIIKATFADVGTSVKQSGVALSAIWSETANAVVKAEEKKKKPIADTAKAVKDATASQQAYADVYKQLTEIIKASQTPEQAHIARLKNIDDLQKKLGGTSNELTAAIAKENKEWAKAEIATQEYKDSVTDVMKTTKRLVKDGNDSMGSISFQMSKALADSFKTLTKGFGDSVGDSLVYGSSLKDSMEGIGKSIVASLISAFVQAQIAGVISGTAINTAWLPWTAAIIVLAFGAIAVAVGIAVSAAWALPAAVILAIIVAVLILKKLFDEFGIVGVIFAPILGTFVLMRDTIKFVVSLVRELFSLTGGGLLGMLDGILSAFRAILDAIKSIVGAAGGIGGGLLGGLGGGLLGGVGGVIGGIGGAIGDVFGFAGGGYTGDGARSGGLDGQGGFMAMLHPQETVVDHALGGGFGSSDGGSGGGVVIQNLTIHVLENATNADVFSRMDKIELRRTLGQPVVDALNEMLSIGVRPRFATENR